MIIDESLSFQKQVMDLKKDCFRILRLIRKVKPFFSQNQLKLIVNSLVVCKLDYCNGLYYGLNESLLDELQLIQNASAKTVFGLYKYDHV